MFRYSKDPLRIMRIRKVHCILKKSLRTSPVMIFFLLTIDAMKKSDSNIKIKISQNVLPGLLRHLYPLDICNLRVYCQPWISVLFIVKDLCKLDGTCHQDAIV